MNLASISENRDIEKRIAITPEIAKKYIGLGFNLTLPNNYGTYLGFTDDEYKTLGVNFSDNEEEIIKNSEVIIQLGLPVEEKLSIFKENQTLIGSLNSFLNLLLFAIETAISFSLRGPISTCNLFFMIFSISLITSFTEYPCP